MWMQVGAPSGRQRQQANGIGQLLSSLDIGGAAQEKAKKPGYLSADGTIVRTDTMTIGKSNDGQAAKTKQKLIKATLGNQWRSSAIRTHMRLARASTQQECKRVAASANLQAGQLKKALGSDCENQTEVRAVLAQMQKAAIRAKMKVRQLGDEQEMERQSKRAAEQQRRVRALYLAQERQKKAVARQVRENGYVRESVVAHYQAAEQMRQQLAAELRAPTVSESTTTVPAASGVVTAATAAPAAAVVAASMPTV